MGWVGCCLEALGRLCYLTYSGSRRLVVGLRTTFLADSQLGLPLAPPGHSFIVGACYLLEPAMGAESFSCCLFFDLLPLSRLLHQATLLLQGTLPTLNLNPFCHIRQHIPSFQGLALGHLWGGGGGTVFACDRNRLDGGGWGSKGGNCEIRKRRVQ